MPLDQLLLTNLLCIAVLMFLVWCASLRLQNASIIDIFWGLGFVLVAWISFAASAEPHLKALVLCVLVTLWGGRLSSYLAWRNWRKPEDFRYQAMRDRHGRRFPVMSLFTVFGLQGLLMWIISLQLQVGASQPGGWLPLASLGLVLWTIGFCFETVGDYQLAHFKSDPANRGQVMNQGLWRYTRHPNYFGDFLVWWGFYFVAADPTAWWWTLISPLLMSFLLFRVSGVRLLETTLSRKITGYEDYVRNTSAFLPLPPRR